MKQRYGKERWKEGWKEKKREGGKERDEGREEGKRVAFLSTRVCGLGRISTTISCKKKMLIILYYTLERC